MKINQDIPGAASLLAAIPGLRELRCPLLEDMAAMVHCQSLRRLELHVDLHEGTRLHIPGVEAFLRSAATHLEHLELAFDKGEECVDAVNLVLSIGGRGKDSAALHSLKFRLNEYDPTQPLQLRPLVAVLHRLPHLSLLDIDGVPSDDFLKALDGEVLPELKELCMATPDGICQHEFAHSEGMFDILEAYPRLHVRLADDRVSCKNCDFCKDLDCRADSLSDFICILWTRITKGQAHWHLKT